MIYARALSLQKLMSVLYRFLLGHFLFSGSAVYLCLAWSTLAALGGAAHAALANTVPAKDVLQCPQQDCLQHCVAEHGKFVSTFIMEAPSVSNQSAAIVLGKVSTSEISQGPSTRIRCKLVRAIIVGRHRPHVRRAPPYSSINARRHTRAATASAPPWHGALTHDLRAPSH